MSTQWNPAAKKLEVLKKKDIYGMKFPEQPLTPMRSRSASPNRPTTPHDCQKRIDFDDDDEDGYRVDADKNTATYTCAHDETFYQCRISMLEKQNISLEKKQKMLESLAIDYLVKIMDLKKMMDSLAEERNDLAQKLKKIELDNAKLEDQNKKLESQSLNTKREQFDDTARNKSNLKKHIKDLEERNAGTDVREAEEKMQKLEETVQEKEQENRDLIVELENLNKKKKDLEDRLRYMVSKDETSKFKNENAELKHNLQNLSKQLKESEYRCKNASTNVQKAEKKTKELDKAIADIREMNKEHIVKLTKFQKEKTDLGSELSSKDEEIKLLYNSLETVRDEHESEIEELRGKITEVQNEFFELWLIVQNIHKCSEISFDKFRSLFDFDFVNQKHEEARAENEHLTKSTTTTLKRFASVQNRTGCIKVLKERFEKSYTSENVTLSDDYSDMEDNTTNFSFNTYSKRKLGENRNMTNCHNRQDKNTNVYNINMNIADSKVSLIDNTEAQMLGMSDRSIDRQEIEAKS